MKKQNKAKKISVIKKVVSIAAISTIALTSIFGLAGCNNTNSVTEAKTSSSSHLHKSTFLEDAYILVPNEKGEFILHKGKVYSIFQEGYYRLAKFGSDELELNCGEKLYTDDYKAYINKPSKEDHYVDYCEDCFFGKTLEREDLEK